MNGRQQLQIPDLTAPRPTLASALLGWAGEKVGGRAGAILRKLGEIMRVSPVEAVPVPAGAVYHPIKKTVGPLYHGAAGKLLPRILREGLLPPAETGLAMFEGPKKSFWQRGVYLTRQPLQAALYAEHAARQLGGRQGVVLRVREVPTRLLEADEDVNIILGALEQLLGREQFDKLFSEAFRRMKIGPTGEFWRQSFRLPVGMAAELGMQPAGRLPGTGTVVHLGRIPPERIEVLEKVPVRKAEGELPQWPKTFAEQERIRNLLLKIRARRKRIPWWLD